VLIVDDNQDAATSLAELLSFEGHDARAVFCGEDTLKLIPTFRPHIAFLDLNMPGMDGLETAKRCRSESWGQDLKLVALTGMGRASDIDRTRAAGFDAHLTKPAGLEDMLRLIAEVNI